jgi:hypothetical protein
MGRIHVCDACVAPFDDPESQMVVPRIRSTPHETRYARRPRAEMCQSVRSDEYGGSKRKKKLFDGMRTSG